MGRLEVLGGHGHVAQVVTEHTVQRRTWLEPQVADHVGPAARCSDEPWKVRLLECAPEPRDLCRGAVGRTEREPPVIGGPPTIQYQLSHGDPLSTADLETELGEHARQGGGGRDRGLELALGEGSSPGLPLGGHPSFGSAWARRLQAELLHACSDGGVGRSPATKAKSRHDLAHAPRALQSSA
jgi:hypothetical protein